MFQSSTYIGRRNQLKKQITSGIILLLGNEESPMNYADNTYHFRQDSSFLYYFGLDYAGLIGYIDVDNQKEYIFGEELSIDYIIWMGYQPTIKEKSLKVGIENTAPISKLEEILKDAKNKGRKIHFLPPYRTENTFKLYNWLGINPNEVNKNASIELIKAIVNQRIFKSQEEITEIDKAASISAEMHLAGIRSAKPGMTEAQVMAKVFEIAQANNGSTSFPVIATINGQTLHNHYHGNTIKEGELFLLDAGFETPMRYAGDLTTTFPVSKKYTDRQKEIYKIVLAAHAKAVSMLKPNANYKDVHLATCKVIAEGMKEMGFLKGNIDDAIAAGAHAMFMPHGTGHMLGLDVHDMEDLGEVYVGYDGAPKSTQFGLKSLRLARPLLSGFVLTVEPGIYFIPELIDKWKSEKLHTDFLNYDKLEQYKDFGGIRNEEDYLITETGTRRLGKEFPKTIEAIEAEREKAF